MAFKQSPFPMIKGTKKHKEETKESALKMDPSMIMSLAGSMGDKGGGGGGSEEPDKKGMELNVSKHT